MRFFVVNLYNVQIKGLFELKHELRNKFRSTKVVTDNFVKLIKFDLRCHFLKEYL